MKRLVFFILGAFAASSCGIAPTAVIADVNKQTATNNTALESITDEMDDLAGVILNGYSDSGTASDGRTDVVFSDDRLNCPGISIAFSNVATDRSSGKLTVTFPDAGCTDGIKTNIRKGTVIVSWSGGKWYAVGSTVVITLQNFSMNGIVVNGTRTLKCTTFTFASARIFDVTWNLAADHTLTWPDGTSATLSVNKTKLWSHGGTGDVYYYTNGPNGDFSVSGTNRHGTKFTSTIQTALVYTRYCKGINKNYLPLAGIEIISDLTNNKTLTLDFGLYVCDNLYTVNVAGVTSNLYGKNDSSDD